MITTPAYNFRCANKRAYKISTCCLLAILFYSCKKAPSLTTPKEKFQGKETLFATQPDHPVVNPQELLEEKLRNPAKELKPIESIALIHHCAELGEHNAATAANKEISMVLGNAGVGKSTFLNCLMECEMKLVKPSELGLSGVKKVVVVDSESIRPEVMPIGHGKRSKTFLPQIELDPNNQNSAYCDCPGFSDTRGAEINIANAINIKKVLQQATGVKAVFLAEYQDLSDRALGIQDMEKMCHQMFGNVDNLRRYQNIVLLGITKAPLYEDDEPITRNMVQSLLIQDNTPTAQILANRLFLFDPLDRASNNPNFWSIERCRTEIAQLDSIPQREATTLFQTVLTDDDQTKLKLIMREQATALAKALERNDYEAAGNRWQSLTRLRVIENDEVEQMIGEHALSRVQHYVLGCVGTFEEYALQYQFDQAERQLALLRMLLSHLPNEDLQANLEELEALLNQCREQKAAEQRNTDQQLTAAKRKAVQEVRAEMEQRIQQMLAQLENMMERMDVSDNERQHIRTMATEGGRRVLEGI